MVRVGVLARFEAEPGSDEEMAAFFREGLPIVETQPTTTVWFAFRISDTIYGAFAAFATAEHREALLASGGPQLSQKYGGRWPHLPRCTGDVLDDHGAEMSANLVAQQRAHLRVSAPSVPLPVQGEQAVGSSSRTMS